MKFKAGDIVIATADVEDELYDNVLVPEGSIGEVLYVDSTMDTIFVDWDFKNNKFIEEDNIDAYFPEGIEFKEKRWWIKRKSAELFTYKS